MDLIAKKLNVNRDVYAVDYDRGGIEGDTIKATFENNEDVSDYTGVNDGRFIVTVAEGYRGTDDVKIEGNVSGLAEGTVTFG